MFGDSVDTDNMYPGFAMKLPIEEAAKHIFYDLRPGWTDEVEPGDIVIAGRNFGIGSSRPVAQLFKQLGVAALVADEFNSLFLRNSINFGLPAVTIPGVSAAIDDQDRVRLNVRDATIEKLDGSGTALHGPAAARVCARDRRAGRAAAQARRRWLHPDRPGEDLRMGPLEDLIGRLLRPVLATLDDYDRRLALRLIVARRTACRPS